MQKSREFMAFVTGFVVAAGRKRSSKYHEAKTAQSFYDN